MSLELNMDLLEYVIVEDKANKRPVRCVWLHPSMQQDFIRAIVNFVPIRENVPLLIYASRYISLNTIQICA